MKQMRLIICVLAMLMLVPAKGAAEVNTKWERLWEKADSLYSVQQYDEALRYAELSAEALRHEHSIEGESDVMNLMALIYVRKGEFNEAVKCARRCYEIDVKQGDPDNISSSLNTLAGIYMSMRQPREAEKYILKGIDYAQKADNPQRMAVLHERRRHLQALAQAHGIHHLQHNIGRRGQGVHLLMRRALVVRPAAPYSRTAQPLDNSALAATVQTDDRYV